MSLFSYPLCLRFFTLISTTPPPSSAQRHPNISAFSSLASPWSPGLDQILLSPNTTFAAWFQPLPTSPNLYNFSVWYHDISETTIVWSANDNLPVNRSSTLSITRSGVLQLSYPSDRNLWPSKPTGKNTTKLTLRDDADFGATRLRRLTLDEDGNLILYSFDPNLGQWTVVWQAMNQLCRIRGTCGPNYICLYDGLNSTSCLCPPGFQPVSGDGKEACERKNPYDGRLYCELLLERLLFGYWSPGTEMATFLRVDRSDTNESIFTGWTDVLETTCPVRVSLPHPPEEPNTTTRNIVLICTLFAAELISGVISFRAFVKKYIKNRDMAQTLGLELLRAGGPKQFGYAKLKVATNDFSKYNIIGKGGFGDVYKRELSDHRVVAVKCLKNVAGGDAEFWAEVTIIAQKHHLNLVRLWGFCAEKAQRILVYEFVPNGSLDKCLFQSVGSSETQQQMAPNLERKPILDWNI
ncbi:unnamed protein product [Ilex paraguariensis]|uniref:non-specific serine/threonine protein kinase n=1 Tax=Ilex paraguariensis TaxID=185542 RepID=A0ABC8T1M8_9AQUA